MVAETGPGTTKRRLRRAAVAFAVLLAFAGLAAGCGEEDDGIAEGAGNPESRLSPEEATAPLAGAPAPLRDLRADANRILAGGLSAFEARIAELRGIPVVVNKWASWCGPCRVEFPYFQSQAIAHEREVAFIGVDSDDGRGVAEQFLEELPVPYPSYEDPDLEIARSLGTGNFFPSTVFIGADGEVAYTKYGEYRSEDELAADIERYAG